MARVWLVEFQDNDCKYMAYGRNKYSMPVSAVRVSTRTRTRMRFPSCLKFLTFANVGGLRRVEREEIGEIYGPVPTEDTYANPRS